MKNLQILVSKKLKTVLNKHFMQILELNIFYNINLLDKNVHK